MEHNPPQDSQNLLDSIDIDELLRKSQEERTAATRLLQEYRIIEQWKQFGNVEFTGSYCWDLMLGSDIDLDVQIIDIDLDKALDIFNYFARKGDFLAFAFIDSVRALPPWADPKTFPVGYFIGMAREFEGKGWKIETWMVQQPKPQADWIKERMTEESQRTILLLKHLKRAQHLQIHSYDIYRAVLLGGVRTLAEAQAWLEHQKERPERLF